MLQTLRKIASNQKAVLLIFTNILTLFLALFSNLSIFQTILIYLIEGFVVIFIGITKLISLKYILKHRELNLKSSAFFYVLSIFFFVIYLFFIWGYLGHGKTSFQNNNELIGFSIAIIILLLNQLYSAVTSFKNQELAYRMSKTLNIDDMEMLPRMLVLHFSFIFGMALGLLFGNFGQGVIIIFVIGKIIAELRTQLNSNQ